MALSDITLLVLVLQIFARHLPASVASDSSNLSFEPDVVFSFSHIRPNDTKHGPIIIRPPRAIAHVAMSSELHYPLTVDPSAPKTTSTQTDRYSCTKWLDTWGRKGGGGTEQEGEMQRHSKVRRIIEPPRAIAHVATSWIRSPHTPASCSDPPRTNTCESWKKIGSQPFSNAV